MLIVGVYLIVWLISRAEFLKLEWRMSKYCVGEVYNSIYYGHMRTPADRCGLYRRVWVKGDVYGMGAGRMVLPTTGLLGLDKDIENGVVCVCMYMCHLTVDLV
jgi:hypothetical protein